MTIKVTKPEINLIEKLNELKQDTGLKGQELMRADTIAEARTAIGAGRKNLIINGGFDVWQRGTSQVSATSVEQKYFADRFGIYPSGGTITADRVAFTQGQTTVPGNPNYHARIAMASGNANNWALFKTKLENPERLANQTYTISFWAKGTNPGGGNFQMYENMYHNNGGTVVPNSENYTTVTVTSSWQKFTFTKTEAAWNSTCVLGNNNYYYWGIIQPAADTSTTAWTLDIANIQLELGSTATNFEHRSYGEELALCQRYYEIGGYGAWAKREGSSNFVVQTEYKVEKRAIPTVIALQTSNVRFREFGVADRDASTMTLNSTTGSVNGGYMKVSGWSSLPSNTMAGVNYTTSADSGDLFAFDADY